MSNRGQVGEALYIKMTKKKFENRLGKSTSYSHGDIIGIDDLEKFNISASVPLHIDNDTQGEYECVCEHGVEVW